MRAVDANVVVRLVVRDDGKQVFAAEDFIAKGAWVSHLVLAETVWVLDAVYDLSAEQIALAVDMLLNHRELAVQDPDGHLPLGTFDRDLAKLDGVKRIR
jgi:predicted nucleic-acid-binding protein